tara:strand:- start:45 stop:791 length:747 start_codon:yes stop_codon:yes gene_type:complete
MSRIDNANYGVQRVGGPGTQGIFEESSTPKHPLGEKVELADGRVFRYASFAAATGAGLLVSQDISATAIVESDGKLTAASAGATDVIYTDSGTVGSATANQYAGGYLHTTDDAGEGYNYRIKSNTAASSNAITFTLFDSLQVAVTTATDVAVTGNLYNKVRAALGTADYIVSGVTPISFTVDYYGWVQTRGIAVILTDDSAIGAGVPVMCGDAQAGAVEVADNSHPLVGFVTHEADDTGYMGVALQLP